MSETDAIAIMLCASGVFIVVPLIVLILYTQSQRQRVVSHKPRLSPEQQVMRRRQVKSMIDKIGKL
ncbi:MAG: hypothetical protein JXA21_05685 [Anaerolineae bacterium]|nr:hypothetical protein [Anaerolineae bacterium]